MRHICRGIPLEQTHAVIDNTGSGLRGVAAGEGPDLKDFVCVRWTLKN